MNDNNVPNVETNEQPNIVSNTPQPEPVPAQPAVPEQNPHPVEQLEAQPTVVEPSAVANPTSQVTPEIVTNVADMPRPGVNPNMMMTPVEPTPTNSQPEKPKKKGSPIILLLLLVICAGGGYYVYNNYLSNNTKEEVITDKDNTTKEKEPKVEKLKEAEMNNYIEDITPLFIRIGEKAPLKVSSIDNATILWYAAVKSFNANNISGLPDSFKKEDVDKVITKVFGKDFKYTAETINCFAGDGVLYNYDEATATFTKAGNHGHGGEGALRLKIYAVDSTKTEDKIELTTKILYGGRCGDICGPITEYYSDAAAKNVVATSTTDTAEYDKIYEEVKDKLPETTFVYTVQSDGNYGLSEIKN